MHTRADADHGIGERESERESEDLLTFRRLADERSPTKGGGFLQLNRVMSQPDFTPTSCTYVYLRVPTCTYGE
jgi:hypothetical protein